MSNNNSQALAKQWYENRRKMQENAIDEEDSTAPTTTSSITENHHRRLPPAAAKATQTTPSSQRRRSSSMNPKTATPQREKSPAVTRSTRQQQQPRASLGALPATTTSSSTRSLRHHHDSPVVPPSVSLEEEEDDDDDEENKRMDSTLDTAPMDLEDDSMSQRHAAKPPPPPPVVRQQQQQPPTDFTPRRSSRILRRHSNTPSKTTTQPSSLLSSASSKRKKSQCTRLPVNPQVDALPPPLPVKSTHPNEDEESPSPNKKHKAHPNNKPDVIVPEESTRKEEDTTGAPMEQDVCTVPNKRPVESVHLNDRSIIAVPLLQGAFPTIANNAHDKEALPVAYPPPLDPAYQQNYRVDPSSTHTDGPPTSQAKNPMYDRKYLLERGFATSVRPSPRSTTILRSARTIPSQASVTVPSQSQWDTTTTTTTMPTVSQGLVQRRIADLDRFTDHQSVDKENRNVAVAAGAIDNPNSGSRHRDSAPPPSVHRVPMGPVPGVTRTTTTTKTKPPLDNHNIPTGWLAVGALVLYLAILAAHIPGSGIVSSRRIWNSPSATQNAPQVVPKPEEVELVQPKSQSHQPNKFRPTLRVVPNPPKEVVDNNNNHKNQVVEPQLSQTGVETSHTVQYPKPFKFHPTLRVVPNPPKVVTDNIHKHPVIEPELAETAAEESTNTIQHPKPFKFQTTLKVVPNPAPLTNHPTTKKDVLHSALPRHCIRNKHYQLVGDPATATTCALSKVAELSLDGLMRTVTTWSHSVKCLGAKNPYFVFYSAGSSPWFDYQKLMELLQLTGYDRDRDLMEAALLERDLKMTQTTDHDNRRILIALTQPLACE